MNTNLFGWSDAVWQLLDQMGILVGDFLMLLTIVGFFNLNSIRNWLTRNRFPSIGGNLEHARWQGLVFTVSRAEVPFWVMDQVQPRVIGLLTTVDSRVAGENIRQQAERQGITIMIETLNDPDDPSEAKRKTKDLLQTLREQGITDIAVDITGGKTPMSVGAFMAAEEFGCDSIYVTADYKEGKPDTNTARIKAISQAHA